MHDFPDNRYEILERARETLRRVNDDERRRRYEEQQRGPVDDLARTEPMPIADWRGCRTVAEMSGKQYSKWVDDGKPPLAAPVATVPKAKVDVMIRAAIDRERENNLARLVELAAIIGEETGKREKALRAEIEALRSEIGKQQRGSDEIVELPNWRSDVVVQH